MMMAGGRRGESSAGVDGSCNPNIFSKTTPEQIYSDFTRGAFTRTCASQWVCLRRMSGKGSN